MAYLELHDDAAPNADKGYCESRGFVSETVAPAHAPESDLIVVENADRRTVVVFDNSGDMSLLGQVIENFREVGRFVGRLLDGVAFMQWRWDG